MNGRRSSPDPSAIDDDWVDAVLRQDAASAPSVADHGFTRRVLDNLPAARQRSLDYPPRYAPDFEPTVRAAVQRSRARWIVVTMALVAFVVGLGVLSGGEVLTFLLTGLVRSGALSLENLLIAAIPLGVVYWLALGAAWQET